MATVHGSSSSGNPSLGFSPSGPFQFTPPGSFSGKREEFEEFSFKFKAYMNLMNPRYAETFKQVEDRLDEEITDSAFSVGSEGAVDQELVQMAHTLQWTLISI